MDDMEEPAPNPAEPPRASPSKSAGSPPADRLAAVIARESGRAKLGPGRVSLEDRMASLATALRRARVENAEQASAVADIRSAEIGRLEILAEALAPVAAQVPEDVDIFDLAISPGERPRLFIDQIGFVEMDRDKRTYRLLQDTRHGRVTLCESNDLDTVVDASTTYIAHRLIERDKALAADYASGGAARALRNRIASERRLEKAIDREPAKRAGLSDALFRRFLFFVEFLGSAAFFGLLFALGLWVWRNYLAK